MNKLKTTTTLLTLLSLLLMGKAWAQFDNGQPVPTIYQTIASGNQSVTSKTITANATWFKWVNDSVNFSIDILLNTQGLNNKLSTVELYKDNAGSLVFVRRDTVKNNRLFLFAKNINPSSSIYFKATTLSTGCSTCTPANPIINLNTLNLTPGCTGYIQPSCELIKDGGFEFFSDPCASLNFTHAQLGQPYAACFWQQACFSGSPDYFNTCSPLNNQPGTNTNFNGFNNYNYLTPHNGDGYSGIYAYSYYFSPLSGFSNNYREYVSQTLPSPLVIGSNYTLKMWVRLANQSTHTTDELHAMFLTGNDYSCLPGVPFGTNEQKINLKNATNTQINNTTGWALLTTTFTATYASTDLIIGNYETDNVSNLSPAHVSGTLGNAYYFIDDVSLRPTSSFSVASQNISLCNGSSQTLTLTSVPNLGAGTYTWTSLPTTATLTSQHNATVAVTNSISTSYSVVVAPGGCANSAVANINIYSPSPAPFLSPNLYSVCPTQTFEIGYNDGSLPIPQFTYTLLPNNITSTTAPYFGNLTTYTTGANTYTVLTGNGTACVGKQVITIYSPNAITTNITNTTICVGQSVTLIANGVNSYTWSTGATTNSILVNPTSTTIYTVSNKNYCNLTTSKTITVTVKPLPSISITTPTIPSLCAATGASSIVTLVASPTPTNAAVTWIATAGTVTIPAGQYTITGNTIKYNISAYTTGTVPINFCATAGSGGCSTSTCTTVYPCCPTSTAITKFTNTTFAVSPSFTTTGVAFSGTITVNAGVSIGLSAKNVFMDPNTKIILNGNAVFDVRNIYMHGCYAMWDGIYANGTANTIKIDKSIVTDALSAINDPVGSAKINLTGNYFNKNQQSVYFGAVKTNTSTVTLTNNLFTCSNITLMASTPWFTMPPNLTNAPTFSTIAITTMLPPYAGKHSYVGIYMRNASHTGQVNNAITIGGATNGTENVFDKLKVGVFVLNSNSKLINNVFQNIRNSTNNATNAFTASAAVQLINFFGPNTLTTEVGGTSTTSKNTFLDNEYGIWSNGFLSLSTTYNRFEKQDNALYVVYNNNNKTVNINNNNFVGCTSGAYFFNNSPIVASISNNNFDNSAGAVGTYSNNFAITCSEAVPAYNPSSFPNYSIYNNNVKNYYKGIMAANTLSTNISDNEVHLLQNYGNDWQYGIHVANCSTPLIKNNIIDMNALSLNWWQVGIDCKINTTPRVQCNSVTNVGIALKFDGSNTTVAGDGIIGNLMQNNAYGMWLVSNGEIGNQFKTVGTTTLSADNAWSGYTCGPPNCYYTFTQQNSNTFNLTGAVLFTRNTGIYNLPNSNVDYFIGTGSNKLFGTNSSTSNTVICSANTYSTPSNLKLGTNALAKLMQGGEDDADDYNTQGANISMSAMSNLTATDDIDNNMASKRAIKHYQLYRNIQLQNIDSTGSSELSGFINAAKKQNTGLFFAVDSLLHRAERDSNFIASAKYLNNSITIKNKVDKTHQEFNSLYTNYLAQRNSLQPNEVKALENVALLCPAIYGTAVYQARAVLFHINRKSYTSDCEKIGPNPSTKKIGQFASTNNDVVIYPNPATNELYIDANGYREVTLKLYNIMGALILDKTVLTNQSIPLANVANGVYTYKVYANGTELKVDKLIIIK